MKICGSCKVEKSPEDFGWKNKALGTKQSYCKTCKNEYGRSWYAIPTNKQDQVDRALLNNIKYREQNREYITQYLSTHPCVDCGNADIEVLEFDHTDRDSKDNDISSMLNGSSHRLKSEIEKCKVRCANCHRKRTRRQLGWWTTDQCIGIVS